MTVPCLQLFNIQNDFTPEEEAQIRKENEWAEGLSSTLHYFSMSCWHLFIDSDFRSLDALSASLWLLDFGSIKLRSLALHPHFHDCLCINFASLLCFIRSSLFAFRCTSHACPLKFDGFWRNGKLVRNVGVENHLCSYPSGHLSVAGFERQLKHNIFPQS